MLRHPATQPARSSGTGWPCQQVEAGGAGDKRHLRGLTRGDQPLEPREELDRRLQYLDDERSRCLDVADYLGAWGRIWRILLITLGALVVAQGAVVKIYGDATWVTLSFIILGVLIAVASGFDAAIKPSERSPKYAQVAFTYERLYRTTMRSLMLLEAEAKPAGVSVPDVLKLLNELEGQLVTIRTEELSLSVDGPLGIGRPGLLKRGLLGTARVVTSLTGRSRSGS
jgi:hypothetical protein